MIFMHTYKYIQNNIYKMQLVCCAVVIPRLNLRCCWNKNKEGNASLMPFCDWT